MFDPCTWHAFKMRHLSSLLRTYLTSNTSCLIEVINAWMPYRARNVYIYLLPSRILFGFFCIEDLSISQSKCCSLYSNDSFFVAGTVTGCIVLRMRIALCNRVGCMETVVVRVLWWSCHYILRIE